MKIIPEIDGISIVVAGPMNPPIFQAYWFEKVGLVDADEAEDCETEIIHKDLSVLKFPNFTVQVQADRLTVSSTRQPYVAYADFVGRLFGEFLIHTPVTAMGINRDVHFPADADDRDRVGNTLAPKEPWGDWGKRVEDSMKNADKDNHGGLISVVLEDRWLTDGEKRRFRVKVEPSNKLVGIYMSCNDHFILESNKETFPGQQVARLLIDHWDKSMERSEKVIGTIMELV